MSKSGSPAPRPITSLPSAFNCAALVVTAMVSKIWNEPVTLVTSTKTITGRSSGSVMRQNICHSVAPSSAAAS